jgi:hypothetical protein
MEELTQCRSLAPTPTGGRSSDMRIINSSTGTTVRYLMFQVERMKKDKQSGYGRITVELTRDGKSSILTKHQRLPRKDSTRNSDSTSIDHSTSDLDFQ